MPSDRRAILAALLLACGSASAQDAKPPDTSAGEAAGRRFPQPVRVGDLIGRRVLQPTESQPVLGRVRRLVRGADGTIAAIVGYGGFLGIGARPISIPVTAMVLLGEHMEVVGFGPDQLDRFPTDDGSGARALAAEETIDVGIARPSH